MIIQFFFVHTHTNLSVQGGLFVDECAGLSVFALLTMIFYEIPQDNGISTVNPRFLDFSNWKLPGSTTF